MDSSSSSLIADTASSSSLIAEEPVASSSSSLIAEEPVQEAPADHLPRPADELLGVEAFYGNAISPGYPGRLSSVGRDQATLLANQVTRPAGENVLPYLVDR